MNVGDLVYFEHGAYSKDSLGVGIVFRKRNIKKGENLYFKEGVLEVYWTGSSTKMVFPVNSNLLTLARKSLIR
tara:strand:- start:158 stop:376 length:219 start_codon:yes stop_codon:yes gene_type:complete